MVQISQRELALMKKYAHPGFWYIEYPHKSFWTSKFTEEDFKRALRNLFPRQNTSPTLLYLHMPYCQKQCWFCTCRVEITTNYQDVLDYLQILYTEIKLHRNFYNEAGLAPNFTEVHLGGGSPTYLQEKEFDELVANLSLLTDPNKLTEFSIEIDPRRVKKDKMKYYHSKGINRISFGVQDLDLEVQKSINRVQPERLTGNLLDPDIRELFPNGVNFDILCGLPNQTPETFARTMEEVVKLSPDRVSLFYMEFAPTFAQHQLQMPKDKLPGPEQKKILFLTALQILLEAGYIRTAYDHFAKPTDAVAKAKEKGEMVWNAFGSSPGRYSNILGLGVHSYSTLGDSYSQNVYGIQEYKELILKGHFPVFRGHQLSNDDRVRRHIIQTLRIYFDINYEMVNNLFGIDCQEYFLEELASLHEFVEDGIVELDDFGIHITEFGQQFAQVVCRNFDQYLKNS